ncbi:LysR family transcriptional regulator [Aquabacterium sp. A7-Y]|uniref:LysR family transcriptional regulator n=1 Tax=Aquabacterium sp. A7-Y TaxID=1349605 RepID=UPI00223DEBFB|nr:LysR family transcriptional regulator [Aquabacterium sp. A7-Y]MCW7542000.1 LysR family transcriptional regulator [Aquabacterium sp. A7-Y]
MQCFVAVAEELNFRRASELLNMSQPPLSRQIQSLEDLLRVQLIRRNTHQVSLTPAGEAFCKDIHSVLVALDAAVASLRKYAEEEQERTGDVRIGLTSVIDFSLIPHLDALIGHPEFAGGQRLERAFSKHLVERVARGQLDVAIVGDIAAPSEELSVESVGRDPMMVALPAGHPAAGKTRLRLADLGDTPLFWFSRADNPVFYDKCERAFRTYGYAAPRRLEPNDFTKLLAAVAAGEGLAFCPASMRAASRIGVVYRPFEEAVERLLTIEVQMVWRAGETRREVLNKIEAIRSALKGAVLPARHALSAPAPGLMR